MALDHHFDSDISLELEARIFTIFIVNFDILYFRHYIAVLSSIIGRNYKQLTNKRFVVRVDLIYFLVGDM